MTALHKFLFSISMPGRVGAFIYLMIIKVGPRLLRFLGREIKCYQRVQLLDIPFMGRWGLHFGGLIMSGKSRLSYKSVAPSISYMFLKLKKIPISFYYISSGIFLQKLLFIYYSRFHLSFSKPD